MYARCGPRAPLALPPAYAPSLPCDTVLQMQFTDAELREYVRMWSDEFHESISLEEARLSATALMDLFILLAFTDGEA